MSNKLLEAYDHLTSLPRAQADELARTAYACLSESEREGSRVLAETIAREYVAAELREKFAVIGFVVPDCGDVSAENVESVLASLAAGANDPADRRAFQTMLDKLRKVETGFNQFYATH
jgi:hypothetical protein